MALQVAHRVYAKTFRILSRFGIAQRIVISLPLQTPTRRFRIPVVGGVGIANFTHGDWWLEDTLAKLLPACRGAFVDVGANVGQTLLKVRTFSPEMPWVGFEPNPICVMYLHRLINANEFTACTVIPAGLDTESGVKAMDCFHEDPADTTASLVPGFRPNDPVLRRLWVPIVDFRTLKRSGVDGPISFVKIDVEGGEKEVLESLHDVLRTDRPFVALEILPVYSVTNRNRIDRQEAIERQLRDLRYTMCRVEKRDDGHCLGLRPLEEIGVHNQLTWSDYLLVPTETLQSTLALVGSAYETSGLDRPARR
jgi:FkbM family methyltransferase